MCSSENFQTSMCSCRPNKITGANSRPAFRFEGLGFFMGWFCRRQSGSAAVAQFCRSALLTFTDFRRKNRHRQQTHQTNKTMKIALTTIALITGFSFCSAFAADTKNPSITLTAPKDTPYASVAKVLDACKAADLTNVTLRTTLTADTKTTGITLTASKDTPYASVAKVLDACKAAGLNTVSLETTPSKETTK